MKRPQLFIGNESGPMHEVSGAARLDGAKDSLTLRMEDIRVDLIWTSELAMDLDLWVTDPRSP